MSNPTTPSAMAPAILQTPKPKSFDGDKNKSREWFQCTGPKFNDADDRKKILVTSQFMDEGPAAAWAGTWCTKELSRPQHDPAKFVWQNFVSAPKDAYALAEIKLRYVRHIHLPRFLATFIRCANDIAIRHRSNRVVSRGVHVKTKCMVVV